MPVVDIRRVGVVMFHGLVHVHMGMPADPVIPVVMEVVAVVMAVTVLVHQALMDMGMPVLLRYQEPGPGYHQGQGGQELQVWGFPEDEDRCTHPDEGGGPEVGPGPGCPHAPEREDEEKAGKPETAEAKDQGAGCLGRGGNRDMQGKGSEEGNAPCCQALECGNGSRVPQGDDAGKIVVQAPNGAGGHDGQCPP